MGNVNSSLPPGLRNCVILSVLPRQTTVTVRDHPNFHLVLYKGPSTSCRVPKRETFDSDGRWTLRGNIGEMLEPKGKNRREASFEQLWPAPPHLFQVSSMSQKFAKRNSLATIIACLPSILWYHGSCNAALCRVPLSDYSVHFGGIFVTAMARQIERIRAKKTNARGKEMRKRKETPFIHTILCMLTGLS